MNLLHLPNTLNLDYKNSGSNDTKTLKTDFDMSMYPYLIPSIKNFSPTLYNPNILNKFKRIHLLPITKKSLSSRLTTKILELRNKPKNKFLRGVTKGLTEVGSLLLTLIAAIETLAHAIFTAGTFIFSLVTKNKKPLNKSLEYLKSSAFTVVWNTQNLFYNIKRNTLPVHEHQARSFLNIK